MYARGCRHEQQPHTTPQPSIIAILYRLNPPHLQHNHGHDSQGQLPNNPMISVDAVRSATTNSWLLPLHTISRGVSDALLHPTLLTHPIHPPSPQKVPHDRNILVTRGGHAQPISDTLTRVERRQQSSFLSHGITNVVYLARLLKSRSKKANARLSSTSRHISHPRGISRLEALGEVPCLGGQMTHSARYGLTRWQRVILGPSAFVKSPKSKQLSAWPGWPSLNHTRLTMPQRVETPRITGHRNTINHPAEADANLCNHITRQTGRDNRAHLQPSTKANKIIRTKRNQVATQNP